ncbi:MAG: DNA replication/repair protein RecF [Acidiferrobacter sp.]
MDITALDFKDVRCLQSIEWSPSPGMNLIVGANGAGKTSLLEGISLAGTGKTLRSGSVRAAIAHGRERLSARLSFGEGLAAGKLRYERGTSEKIWVLDDSAVKSAAEVYERLPLMIFSPESHYAMLQEANARREVVYWLMFHVEPFFLDTWRRYQRLLRQRNAALRMRDRNYRAFDPGLVQLSAVLADMWQRAAQALEAPFAELVERQRLGGEAQLVLRPGWQGDSLAAALEVNRETDERLGYTLAGPHRADVGFKLNGRPIQEVASHGQQKILMSAWRLAVVMVVVAAGKHPVLLLDDLAAELDAERRASFFGTLTDIGLQTFVTAIDQASFPSPATVFHVEHGCLRGP